MVTEMKSSNNEAYSKSDYDGEGEGTTYIVWINFHNRKKNDGLGHRWPDRAIKMAHTLTLLLYPFTLPLLLLFSPINSTCVFF